MVNPNCKYSTYGEATRVKKFRTLVKLHFPIRADPKRALKQISFMSQFQSHAAAIQVIGRLMIWCVVAQPTHISTIVEKQ